jgi:hypothetical protein
MSLGLEGARNTLRGAGPCFAVAGPAQLRRRRGSVDAPELVALDLVLEQPAVAVRCAVRLHPAAPVVDGQEARPPLGLRAYHGAHSHLHCRGPFLRLELRPHLAPEPRRPHDQLHRAIDRWRFEALRLCHRACYYRHLARGRNDGQASLLS